MPRYETQEHLTEERRIAALLSPVWRCDLWKLGANSPIDYCAVRGKKVVAWVEIKTRDKTMADIEPLGGVMVDLHKVKEGCAISSITELPLVLVYGLRDGIYTTKLLGEFKPDGLTVCGRQDRGDRNDIKACALYRAERWTRVNIPQTEAA